MYSLQKKEDRQAKCRGKVCKKEREAGTVCLQVLGGLTIPFNIDHVVSQTMYFCANGHCIKTASSCAHVSYPKAIFVSPSIDENEKEAFRRKCSIALKLNNQHILSFSIKPIPLPALVQRRFDLF